MSSSRGKGRLFGALKSKRRGNQDEEEDFERDPDYDRNFFSANVHGHLMGAFAQVELGPIGGVDIGGIQKLICDTMYHIWTRRMNLSARSRFAEGRIFVHIRCGGQRGEVDGTFVAGVGYNPAHKKVQKREVVGPPAAMITGALVDLLRIVLLLAQHPSIEIIEEGAESEGKEEDEDDEDEE